MAYDLQDQEQIAEFKAFWNRYGNTLMWLIALGLAIFAGYRAWGWYQAGQSEAAAKDYAGLVAAVEGGKVEHIRERYQALTQGYGDTIYAGMAGLRAAEAFAGAGQTDDAISALKDVIGKSQEPGFKQIASVRLAGVLLDQKKYDEALKVLEPGATGKVDGELAGAIADRRGDVLAAQGKVQEARTEFEQALKLLPASAPLRQLVQFKLERAGS